MKRLLMAVLIILILSCNKSGDSEEGNNTVKYEYYNDGNLHKVYIYSNDEIIEYCNEYAQDGWLERHTIYIDNQRRHLFEYDQHGNKIKENYFNKDGNLNQYVINQYDDTGNRTRKSNFSPDDKLTGYTDYNYDESGKKAGHTTYSNDGSMIKQFDYDPEETRQTSYDKDGKITYSESKGDNIRYFHYNDNGDIKYSYEYKKNETTSNQHFYDASGKLMHVYTYNEEGMKTRQENYKDGTMTSAIEYEYNKKGQVVKRQNFNAENKLDTYYIYEFDSRGKRTRVNVYDKNGKLKERL